MPYAEILPDSALRSLVARYWAISAPYTDHRVLPDGGIDVLVLGGVGARVLGTMSRAIVAPASPRPIVGVRFHPGEAARLARAAPRELTDATATLERIWEDDGRALEDAIVGALDRAESTPDLVLARIAPLLDAALTKRLAAHDMGADVRVRAAAGVLVEGGTVRTAAERACLSERQLARRFEGRIGLAPKTFGRVMRLQRATRLLATGASASAAAAHAGYSDPAHFSNDAKSLAGITPAALARELAG